MTNHSFFSPERVLVPPERHGKSQAHTRKLNGAERQLASLSSRRSAVEVLRLPFLAFHPQITPHSKMT